MADPNHELTAVTRQEAIALGLRFYVSGTACRAGHTGPRYVSSMGCVACAIASDKRSRAQEKARREVEAPPRQMHERVVLRCDAIAAGATRYFTGMPCTRGHVAERLVGNATCVACDLARKVGDPAVRERQKAYYGRTRTERIEWQTAYNAGHREEIQAKQKAYRAANRDRLNAQTAAWAKANPKKRRAKEKAREGRERGATGTFTAADIEAIGKAQRWRCASPACRRSIRKGYHVDHVMPLALGGSNQPRNLALMCAPCNQAKHAHHPIEWAQSLGLLV
jgi:5-methylcytosine-specific restriction endonuclease McrA